MEAFWAEELCHFWHHRQYSIGAYDSHAKYVPGKIAIIGIMDELSVQ